MASLGTLSVAIDSEMGGLQRGLAQSAAGLKKLLGPIGLVSAAVVGVGVGAVKMAATFESQMSKIEGAIGVSRQTIDVWSEQILQMAPKLGQSTGALAEGLFFVASAGFRGKEAMDVLTQAAMASTAGFGEVETIADSVTSAILAYGRENLTAAEATDILSASIREGKMQPAEFAPALKKVAGTAAEMGVELSEAAGMLSVMSLTMESGARASTSLLRIMEGLLNPTGTMREEMERLGTSAQEVRDSIREDGLLDTLSDLRDRAGENEESLAKVMGSSRALRGALAVLNTEASEVDRVMQGVAESQGITAEAFEVAKDTAEELWNELKINLSVLMIKLGNEILPHLKEAVGFVNEVFEILTGHAKSADERFSDLVDSVHAADRKFINLNPNLTESQRQMLELYQNTEKADIKFQPMPGRVDDTSGALEDMSEAAIAAAEGILAIVSAIQTVIGWIQTYIGWIKTLHGWLQRLADFAKGGGIPGAAIRGEFSGGKFRRRQHGGPLGAGQMALVGEAGPELFVPGTAGNVVPNNALGGSRHVHYHLNVNGVPVSSFDEGVAVKLLRRMELMGAHG